MFLEKQPLLLLERTFLSFGVSPWFLLKYYNIKIERKIRKNTKE